MGVGRLKSEVGRLKLEVGRSKMEDSSCVLGMPLQLLDIDGVVALEIAPIY